MTRRTPSLGECFVSSTLCGGEVGIPAVCYGLFVEWCNKTPCSEIEKNSSSLWKCWVKGNVAIKMSTCELEDKNGTNSNLIRACMYIRSALNCLLGRDRKSGRLTALGSVTLEWDSLFTEKEQPVCQEH